MMDDILQGDCITLSPKYSVFFYKEVKFLDSFTLSDLASFFARVAIFPSVFSPRKSYCGSWSLPLNTGLSQIWMDCLRRSGPSAHLAGLDSQLWHCFTSISVSSESGSRCPLQASLPKCSLSF